MNFNNPKLVLVGLQQLKSNFLKIKKLLLFLG